MRKKVVFARLHEGIHLPGVGDLGTVLPAAGKTLEGLDMYISELGLEAVFKYSRNEYYLIIPSANIKFMRLVKEAEVKKNDKSKDTK